MKRRMGSRRRTQGAGLEGGEEGFGWRKESEEENEEQEVEEEQGSKERRRGRRRPRCQGRRPQQQCRDGAGGGQ